MNLVAVANLHNQQFTVLLAGQQLNCRLWYQPLSESWFLSLSLGATRLLSGRQVTVDARLVRRPDFQGELLVIRLDGVETERLGPYPWGTTHALVYLTADEATVYRWVRP